MRKQFSKSVTELADRDDKAIMLIGDISHYLLKDLEAKHPNRFYNLGICEQSLIGMASGMALSGMRPIVHTIAPFCVERAFEQIKIDLCYQKTDVTIISVGSSFDYAHLGCTHHCYEDVSILRSLPNMQIFVPGNSKEFDTLLKQTWGNGSPKYFKLSNKEHRFDFDIKPFEHHVVNSGKSDKIIFVNGHLLDETMEAADEQTTVVYVPTLSSLKEECNLEISKLVENKQAYIIEENSQIGGLADFVFDICAKYDVALKAKKIGIPNEFLTNYGKPEEHRAKLGLTIEHFKKIIGSNEV